MGGSRGTLAPRGYADRPGAAGRGPWQVDYIPESAQNPRRAGDDAAARRRARCARTSDESGEKPRMKSITLLALLLCGLILRTHGWQFLAHKQTLTGSLLVVGGTLVTLSIIVILVIGG